MVSIWAWESNHLQFSSSLLHQPWQYGTSIPGVDVVFIHPLFRGREPRNALWVQSPRCPSSLYFEKGHDQWSFISLWFWCNLTPIYIADFPKLRNFLKEIGILTALCTLSFGFERWSIDSSVGRSVGRPASLSLSMILICQSHIDLFSLISGRY